MNKEKYDKIIEELRDLWRNGKFQDLRKKYVLCAWMLTKEDRDKIEAVIGKQFREESTQDPLITYAVNELGYKKIA